MLIRTPADGPLIEVVPNGDVDGGEGGVVAMVVAVVLVLSESGRRFESGGDSPVNPKVRLGAVSNGVQWDRNVCSEGRWSSDLAVLALGEDGNGKGDDDGDGDGDDDGGLHDAIYNYAVLFFFG